jgi:phospholipid/cholesterol/gamma-HCH transport system substrate-binding protein
MNHNTVETVLGGVVLAVAGVFLAIALPSASFKQTSGYNVNASFSKADGINPGMDVRMSGVKIGSVSDITLDPKTYLANVKLTIQNSIELPTDTVAKVASESLLGGKYLTLEPGADEEMIKDGGKIQYTQAAINLEDLIGRFIFSNDKEDKKTDAQASPAADTSATPAASSAPSSDANF